MFYARGIVDNTNGTTHIKGFKVVVREFIKRISEYQRIDTDSNDFVIF